MFSLLQKPSFSLSIIASALVLTGCGSSSSDDSDTGYIQVYNASANAPNIYLTVDEDLDEDDDEDIFEHTYSGVEYAQASSLLEIEKGDYYAELAYQIEDSTARDDLELFYQQPIELENDMITMYVIAEDISAPNVLTYQLELIDDDEDDDDDLFNLRFLNLQQQYGDLDVYMSLDDETFNEAELVSSLGYTELTENQKFDQEDYKFYITASGMEEVLFESEEISFPYSSQYVISVRENQGADGSPFVIDLISKSNTTEYEPVGAKATYRVFNAIQENELLADYTGALDLFMETSSDTPDISNLAIGEFSERITTEHGDYSFAVNVAGTDIQLLKNHLITLSENDEKTIFFYTNEEYVDLDEDGDVDEDGDGIPDEIEIKVNSLVVENTATDSIYQHQINIVNLIDDEDFSAVTVYFVRSDELIENADNKKTVAFTNNDTLSLLNNTYDVFVVANVDSSDVILSSETLVLNEDSEALFLVLEADENMASGYNMQFVSQSGEE